MRNLVRDEKNSAQEKNICTEFTLKSFSIFIDDLN